MARIKIKVHKAAKQGYIYGLPDGTILKATYRKALYSEHYLYCVKGTMVARFSDTPLAIDKSREYTFFEREVEVIKDG